MKNIFEFVVGDWSNDGHGRTETYYAYVNADIDEVKRAYKKGTKIVGFDLTGIIAADYEESIMREDHVTSLKEHGFDFSSTDCDFDEDSGEVELYPESFRDIYFFICRLGDPKLEFEIIRPNTMKIGGYGLFNG